MRALVLSYHVEPTMDAIRRRADARWPGDICVVDTQQYPGEVGLTVEQDGPSIRARLHLPEGDVDLSDLRGVWTHRFAESELLPAAWPADLRKATLGEAEAVLLGALAALPGVIHVNAGPLDAQAQHKLLLHELGARAGLTVPATCAGTEAPLARAFGAGRDLVYKHINALKVPGKRGAALFTTRVKPELLADDASMRLCPVLLQQEIRKARELRVVVVGRETFSVSIDPSTVRDAEVDWRVGRFEHADHWQRDVLNPDVEACLFRLMDTLGLQYGAADIIRTPEGEHVFLEVNPSGGFLWVDRAHDGAVIDAILDLLVDPSLRRPLRFPTVAPASPLLPA